MDSDDGNDEFKQALALSMQEVTSADLVAEAQQDSNSTGSRKRGLSKDEEGSEVTKKRSSGTLDDDADGASASAAATSTVDSNDLFDSTAGALPQRDAATAAPPEDNLSEPPVPATILYPAASSAPPASRQITAEAMAEAMAQAFSEMQQATQQTSTQGQEVQAPPLLPAPAVSQPQHDTEQGFHNMLAAQQAAMTAGGADMLHTLGVDAATAAAMAAALGMNQSGPAGSNQAMDTYGSDEGESMSDSSGDGMGGVTSPSAVASATFAQPRPEWAQRLINTDSFPAEELPVREPISIQSKDLEAIRIALQTTMGLPVRFQGALYSPPLALAGAPPEPLAVTVSLSTSESGYLLTPASLDAVVKARVSGSRLRKYRQSEMAVLAAVYDRAVASAAVPSAACTTLQALRMAACRRAVSILAAGDADDLYFKVGENAESLLQAMAARQVSPAFLAEMVLLTTREQGRCWSQVLDFAFSALADWDFSPTRLESALFVLDQLTRVPQLQAQLVYKLLPSLSLTSGSQLEVDCFLSPLLSVGSIADAASVMRGQLLSPTTASFADLRNYPAARGEAAGASASIRAGLQRVQAATREIAMRIIKCKVVGAPKVGQEVMLAWLAAAAGSNFVRTQGGEVRGVLGRWQLMLGSSDRFALGAAALGLQLCRPFLSGQAKHLRHLEATYYKTAAYRLYTPCKPSTLAAAEGEAPGGDAAAPSTIAPEGLAAGADAADEADEADPVGQPSWDGHPYMSPQFPASNYDAGREALLPAPPHFIAECFFITAQLMHTCVIPAVHRYEQLLDMKRRKQKQTGQEGSQDLVGGLTRDTWLLIDTSTAQLGDPGFAGDAVQFAVLQIKWMLSLLRQPDARKTLSLVPDSVPKDAASWLAFCVRMGRADLVSSSDVGALVEGVVALLECSHIASPLVADKLVTLLLTMLSSEQGHRNQASSAAASRALKLAVLGTGAAQQHLLPALMRVYAAADAVVGLDVDRDSFDKFSMRHHIDLLLLEIWMDPAQKRALTLLARQAAAASASPKAGQSNGTHDAAVVLVDFARALLNSLMYMLGDSLERLFDVHTIENAQRNESTWQALPAEEQERKQQFAEYQRGLGGSYMRTAVTTLQLLLELVSDDDFASAFVAPSLVPLAAFASLHFLELLVGPKGAGLKIQNPSKIGFDPVKLSVFMSEFMLHLARSPVFINAVAAEQDYNEAILQDFHDKVVGGELGNHAHASGLVSLMQQVTQIRSKEAASNPGTAAPGGVTRPHLAELSEAETEFAESEADNLQEAYVEALQELQRTDFDSTVAGAYASLYAGMAESIPGDTAGKMRRLQRELRNLSGRTQLPLNQAAAIFLRYDSDRIDKMRAILTGPEDTPYAGGLFVFDLFFPPQYPSVPPSVRLETTGNGIARFNPNLYADGKVCLSLLGTFSSGGATERWNAATSSLFQVLVSIQAMILVDDPYFNEPSVEKMRATAEGNATSAEYNFGIQLNTMRLAMIAHLKRPPPGFEEVVKAHFRLLRSRIMRTATKWLSAAAELSGIDEVLLLRMRSTVVELHGLLAVL